MWWTFSLSSYNGNAGIIRNLRCVCSFVYLNKNDVHHPCRVCSGDDNSGLPPAGFHLAFILAQTQMDDASFCPISPSFFCKFSPPPPFFFICGTLFFFGRSRWPATSRWHVRLNAGLCAGQNKINMLNKKPLNERNIFLLLALYTCKPPRNSRTAAAVAVCQENY